jgi:isocitrate dehydrogenase (NAD+)
VTSYRVAELLGDGISAELSESIHALAAALPVKLELNPVDLSLERRRKDGLKVYDAALEVMRGCAASLKYPTTTETESPNKVLREKCAFSVIHRPCATIPGVPTNFTKPIDVDIVRVATGGLTTTPAGASAWSPPSPCA